MNPTGSRISIAAMVLGIVSVSLCIPAMIFSFFWILQAIAVAAAALVCGILAIILGVKGRQLKSVGRAIAGFVLGIIGTSISGLLVLSLLTLCILF